MKIFASPTELRIHTDQKSTNNEIDYIHSFIHWFVRSFSYRKTATALPQQYSIYAAAAAVAQRQISRAL